MFSALSTSFSLAGHPVHSSHYPYHHHRYTPTTDSANIATKMNVVVSHTAAVPDSAFPWAGTEFGGLVSLLDTPASPAEFPLAELKLVSMQGDDGYFPGSDYSSYPFDQDYLCQSYDWMSQDILLPSPEERGTDVGPFLPPPPASFSSSSSLPTPESSNPSTPASHCQDSEVLDALSLIDGSPTSRLNQSADILPQFDGQSPLPSPASYNPSSVVTYSPSLTTYDFPPSSSCDPAVTASFLPSPLPSTARDLSPQTNCSYSVHSNSSPPLSPDTLAPSPSSRPEEEGIRDLLGKTEDAPATTIDSSRKRKPAEESSEATTPSSEGPRVKRKRLTKTAKKERKKEQNKQAAFRYRRRRKGEADVIDDRKDELEALNSDLKNQVNTLSTEIAYLKNLWSEIEATRAQKEAAQWTEQ